jgi:hypothetical protein
MMTSGLFGDISPVIASESEAIQEPRSKSWIASSQELLAMTELAIPIRGTATHGGG